MDGPVGTVTAFAAPRRFGGFPRSGLFFLPLAIFVAGVAALVMFRLLVRRIRALESLAQRVRDGDLTAQVENPGRDELGRLGHSLNTMTETLADARDRLESAGAQRRQLFADITHELATPLTSIRGYAETLRNPALDLTDGERARYVAHIQDESIRMGLMLEDLLELTRLEAGVIQLEPERLDFSALCSNTLVRFGDRADRAGLRLDGTAIEPGIELTVDGRRMEQVLDNLVTNALRYVPAGGEVRVSLHHTGSGVRLVFEDDGPGFGTEDLKHALDRFYRGDAARSEDGTGLGLAIVAEIVRQHGGTVQVTNRELHGARITVEFPG